MNASQSKQVLTIAQEAIAMLPHEMTLALRVRLEQAIASPIVSKAKSAKISKKALPYKPIKSLTAHVFEGTIDADGKIERPDIRDTSCLCAGCQIDRGFFERGRMEVVMLANVIQRESEARFDKKAVIAKLAVCACGHSADSHEKDDLENLLACSHHFGHEDTCDCTHFHYDIDSEAA